MTNPQRVFYDFRTGEDRSETRQTISIGLVAELTDAELYIELETLEPGRSTLFLHSNVPTPAPADDPADAAGFGAARQITQWFQALHGTEAIGGVHLLTDSVAHWTGLAQFLIDLDFDGLSANAGNLESRLIHRYLEDEEQQTIFERAMTHFFTLHGGENHALFYARALKYASGAAYLP